MNASFADIAEALRDVRRVLVSSHFRPDGDALGSTIAFALWLKAQGKDVTAWNADGVQAKFHYLPQHELVTQPTEESQAFDVVVALDNATKNRLRSVVDKVSSGARWINIDHHVSNGLYGDLNYIDPTAPATGQIVYEFFRDQGVTITRDMAVNLYAAISTDTGSFQYAGTGSRTFAAAAGLVEAGVDVAQISQQMYDNQPKRRLELLRHALNVAKFTCDDRLASVSLSLAKVAELGVLPEDNEGLSDNLRSVEGVVAAVFFEELPEGAVRVSARSKDLRVDMCRICQKFGGGGHPLAAGARMKGTLAEVETIFLDAVSHEIRNRN